MGKINNIALAIASAIALSACGQSTTSLCEDQARLISRFSELVVKGANDPTKFDAAELQKTSDALLEVKRKLESKGKSGKDCQ